MDNEQLLKCYNQASIGPLSSRMLTFLLNLVIGVKGHRTLKEETRCL